MRNGTLPEHFQALRFAEHGRELQVEIPLQKLARFSESLASQEGSINLQLTGDKDNRRRKVLRLEMSGTVQLECQLSKQVYGQPIAHNERYWLVYEGSPASESQASDNDEIERVTVDEDGYLDLLALVEDELILSLPLVPINPEATLKNNQAESQDYAEAASEAEDSAFAALKNLTIKPTEE